MKNNRLKKLAKSIRSFMLMVLVVILTTMSSLTVFAANAGNAGTNKTIPANDNRIGKRVRVYVDMYGNETAVVINPGGITTRSANGDELVAEYTLTAAQTAQMKDTIQGISIILDLISLLKPFIPDQYEVFLEIAQISVFAEDVRWAGAYGKEIRMREWCHLPHTSYSHYYEYEIL